MENLWQIYGNIMEYTCMYNAIYTFIHICIYNYIYIYNIYNIYIIYIHIYILCEFICDICESSARYGNIWGNLEV